MLPRFRDSNPVRIVAEHKLRCFDIRIEYVHACTLTVLMGTSDIEAKVVFLLRECVRAYVCLFQGCTKFGSMVTDPAL
jgi:hypothetical protein